jgi:hypothetical protein
VDDITLEEMNKFIRELLSQKSILTVLRPWIMVNTILHRSDIHGYLDPF